MRRRPRPSRRWRPCRGRSPESARAPATSSRRRGCGTASPGRRRRGPPDRAVRSAGSTPDVRTVRRRRARTTTRPNVQHRCCSSACPGARCRALGCTSATRAGRRADRPRRAPRARRARRARARRRRDWARRRSGCAPPCQPPRPARSRRSTTGPDRRERPAAQRAGHPSPDGRRRCRSRSTSGPSPGRRRRACSRLCAPAAWRCRTGERSTGRGAAPPAPVTWSRRSGGPGNIGSFTLGSRIASTFVGCRCLGEPQGAVRRRLGGEPATRFADHDRVGLTPDRRPEATAGVGLAGGQSGPMGIGVDHVGEHAHEQMRRPVPRQVAGLQADRQQRQRQVGVEGGEGVSHRSSPISSSTSNVSRNGAWYVACAMCAALRPHVASSIVVSAGSAPSMTR